MSCSLIITISLFDFFFFCRFNRHLCHGAYWCTHNPAHMPKLLPICIFIPHLPNSKIKDCTHWHINPRKLLFCLCVLSYSSFLYTCVCVFLHFQSPLQECHSIRSSASGLPYYCAPLACVSDVMELLAVWRHNKPKTKNLYTGLRTTPSQAHTGFI